MYGFQRQASPPPHEATDASLHDIIATPQAFTTAEAAIIFQPTDAADSRHMIAMLESFTSTDRRWRAERPRAAFQRLIAAEQAAQRRVERAACILPQKRRHLKRPQSEAAARDLERVSR